MSIWAYGRLYWRLSDEWQLICGIPVKEYTLRYELELARRQAAYFANYAYDLQWQILFSDESDKETTTAADQQRDNAGAESEPPVRTRTFVRQR